MEAFSKLAPLEAILFDIDGTLCDSDPIHYYAFREMLQEVSYSHISFFSPPHGPILLSYKSFHVEITTLVWSGNTLLNYIPCETYHARYTYTSIKSYLLLRFIISFVIERLEVY